MKSKCVVCKKEMKGFICLTNRPGGMLFCNDCIENPKKIVNWMLKENE